MKNKFCSVSELVNEADVEAFFLLPLFRELGYENKHIKSKRSLDELSVKALGTRRAVKYKPDYAIKIGSQLRLIVEAKAPTENLDEHVLQARDYSVTLNGAHAKKKPVRYFLLSNGHLTRLYKVDLNEPILELKFKDFDGKSRTYKRLIEAISKNSLEGEPSEAGEDFLVLRKAPLRDVNEAFSWCHQFIYKTDNISQGAAFMEFVKIIALKLLSDKKVREKHPEILEEASFKVPLTSVRFSKALLAEQEKHTPNPLSTIWFADFIKEMEREIASRKKKRIFEQSDSINLEPETINGVVSKLEGLFLFGIDADLNGRLFETFLSATMRGKDLGQYFTPRSLVKLGVGLARLNIDFKNPEATDKVYDGCCGTGGFLIDVLADMWAKVNGNNSISDDKKESLRNRIANGHIFGADIGRDPNLCRIARLNMYLHGDGGTSIFNVDALDKELPDNPNDPPEVGIEKEGMRAISEAEGGFFDVVITNPPFAKRYSSASKDKAKRDADKANVTNAARILKQYELLTAESGRAKTELRSNLMFIERYRDLLKPGGRLVTVIDDGILSARDYAWFRKWLFEEFLINAVVSLPGDAFQRSAARVKTSLLVLTKRATKSERQPNVFMYPCTAVGIDDPERARTLPIDAVNREKAKKEIAEVLSEYDKFLSGGAKKYTVLSSRITDRLDVKHCLMAPGSNVSKWKKAGFTTIPLSEVLEPAALTDESVVDCAVSDAPVTPLIVRYDGSAIAGTEIIPSETQHGKLFKVMANQVVVSNIAASRGSIAVVPANLEGCVVSNEYTILETKAGFDPSMVWAILRSPVVLSEILLVATGANRTRAKWDAIQDLVIPYPTPSFQKKFTETLQAAAKAEEAARHKRESEINHVVSDMLLRSADANTILSAFKPPE